MKKRRRVNMISEKQPKLKIIPYLGYEKSTKVAQEALKSGRTVYAIVQEKGYLTREELDKILNPENMIKQH